MSVPLLEMARRQLNHSTHRLYTLPILTLMPHSRCNCRCVMCDIWKANRGGQELSREQLEPHLHGLRGLHLQWVILSGGEALMHRNLWSLCELLRELDVKITLLSTGLLLERHAADVVTWCDEVIVSLDGPPAIHDAIRNVPRAFDRLAEGVVAVRTENSAVPIRARSVIQRRNYAHLPQTIATAQSLALDSISFLGADVSSTAFNRPEGWSGERVDDVALSRVETDEFVRVVEAVVEQYAEEIASGFVVESAAKLRRLAHYFAALNGSGPLPEVRCNAPWVSAVVEADGTVRPCFFHRTLGNIHEAPLEEILNGEEAVAFRRDLDVVQNPVCRRCTCSLTFGRRATIDFQGARQARQGTAAGVAQQ